MDYMATVSDKYFDLAIVDPPYGINFSKFNRTNKASNGERIKANKYKNGDWDTSIPDTAYFNELKRISRDQIVWGGNYYFNELGNSKGLICWYKHQPVDNFSDCEFAWVSYDRPAKVFDYPYYGNLEGNSKATQKIHPTQKPVQLYQWLLKNYSEQGFKIFDSHLGSGSHALACYNYNLQMTACEIDSDYYNLSLKRFKGHISQTKLFDYDYSRNQTANLPEAH